MQKTLMDRVTTPYMNTQGPQHAYKYSTVRGALLSMERGGEKMARLHFHTASPPDYSRIKKEQGGSCVNLECGRRS